MTIQEFEQKHNVRLLRKDKSFTMRLIGLFIPGFIENFFTTYRLPFGRPVITYPPAVSNPLSRWYADTLEHELMHVEQFRPWYAPITMGLAVSVFPLPTLFSGRWWVERYPYLNDIKKGVRTVEDATDTLWSAYGWCWPRCLMRKWFNKKL